MKGQLIVGLDLGSSAIRIVAAQLMPGKGEIAPLTCIGAAETKSEGISKASISSFEDAVSSISACLDQAERVIGIPIEEVYVSIGGTQVSVEDAKGVIGVSRNDQTIRREDVARAIDAARAYAQTPNYEIIHVLPKKFSVDSQADIKDPAGMQGIRLEAEVKIIQGLSNHLRNITKAVFRTKVDIVELVYSPIAAAEAVMSKRAKEQGVCVINLGATTTGIAIFEDNELVHANTLLIGADHITADLVYTLRTSFEVAERLKRARGNAKSESLDKEDMVDLKDYGAETSEQIQLKFVAEVIEARVEEIFEKVEEELKRIERSGMLPAGIILTGGGAKLPGITEVARQVFHLPASVGASSLESSVPELIQDPAFATAVGLVEWGYEAERQDNITSGLSGGGKIGSLFSKASEPLKRIFKSFMP
ncbi:MAG: cell division protein FtsA [Patescibacteria group bacterium]|nr:cell division protein FtsA [Patescibacteria group bacterium]